MDNICMTITKTMEDEIMKIVCDPRWDFDTKEDFVMESLRRNIVFYKSGENLS